MIKFLCLIGSILTDEIHCKNEESAPAVFKQELIENRKVCPYGSISLSSGPGVSWRNRTGSKGKAMDLSVGFGDSGFFDGRDRFSRLSADYNWMKFASDTSANSLYFSYGIGGGMYIHSDRTYPLIYFPLRAGYQAKYGFADAGINMFFPLPVPEVRLGIGFDY